MIGGLVHNEPEGIWKEAVVANRDTISKSGGKKRGKPLNPQMGQFMSQLRYEPSISKIRVWSVPATPACLANSFTIPFCV